MNAVSRFEYNLLSILRYFLGQVPVTQVSAAIAESSPAPKCLSRTTVLLMEDYLRKGCPLLLTRWGAWENERFLRNGKGVSGSLWERTLPDQLGLHFSTASVKFLICITTKNTQKEKITSEEIGHGLTDGDLFLLFLAYVGLREIRPNIQIPVWEVFERHPLCRLFYPEDFGVGSELNFRNWMSGTGSFILESLQGLLASRWNDAEWEKISRENWQEIQRIGRSQEQVIQSFFQAVESANRRDLAKFIFPVISNMLPENASNYERVRAIPTTGQRLADRSETFRLALVVIAQIERLRQWDLQARGVGYFDEDYGISQYWKAEFDRFHGKALHARVRATIAQFHPFQQTQGEAE